MFKNYNNKRISISDFGFIFLGRGAYNVTYTSPITYKTWTTRVTDMEYIDLTKNAEEPKVKDLERLKRKCKNT
jgi:hypothetical protein